MNEPNQIPDGAKEAVKSEIRESRNRLVAKESLPLGHFVHAYAQEQTNELREKLEKLECQNKYLLLEQSHEESVRAGMSRQLAFQVHQLTRFREDAERLARQLVEYGYKERRPWNMADAEALMLHNALVNEMKEKA